MSDAMKFFFCFKIAQLERSQSVNADTFYNQIYMCRYFISFYFISYVYRYICMWNFALRQYLLLLLFLVVGGSGDGVCDCVIVSSILLFSVQSHVDSFDIWRWFK